jgi:4-hydroxy-tetrahydrodipicolinate reductase
MGGSIVRRVIEAEDLSLVCALEARGKPEKGRDIGELLGLGRVGVPLSTSEELEEALRKSRPDVLVDFTNPGAAMRNIKAACSLGIDLVVGTTGFTEEQLREIHAAVRENKVAAVVSPNMATGVNIFFKLARDVAGLLGDAYDVEIIEAHHRFKKDAPSGTALKVGELIASALGRDLRGSAVYGRGKGVTGERRRDEIGFHSIRGGDIVGEHTVVFAGMGERLEITHRASTRDAFVEGALKAIRFLKGREKGRVYSTWDVLRIK